MKIMQYSCHSILHVNVFASSAPQRQKLNSVRGLFVLRPIDDKQTTPREGQTCVWVRECKNIIIMALCNVVLYIMIYVVCQTLTCFTASSQQFLKVT